MEWKPTSELPPEGEVVELRGNADLVRGYFRDGLLLVGPIHWGRHSYFISSIPIIYEWRYLATPAAVGPQCNPQRDAEDRAWEALRRAQENAMEKLAQKINAEGSASTGGGSQPVDASTDTGSVRPVYGSESQSNPGHPVPAESAAPRRDRYGLRNRYHDEPASRLVGMFPFNAFREWE